MPLLLFTELSSRLANRVRLTSDGHLPYLTAVDAALAVTLTTP